LETELITRNELLSDSAIELLPGRLRNKPRIEALLRSWIDEFQLIEDALYDLINETGIDKAAGVHLDNIGKILLVVRPVGTNDIDYRAMLTLQQARLKSSGRHADLLLVMSLLEGSGTSYKIVDSFPAEVIIDIATVPVSDKMVLLDSLGSIKAAGVRLWITFPEHTPSLSFRISTTGSTVASTRGFGGGKLRTSISDSP
jgi:hypothetical protein